MWALLLQKLLTSEEMEAERSLRLTKGGGGTQAHTGLVLASAARREKLENH